MNKVNYVQLVALLLLAGSVAQAQTWQPFERAFTEAVITTDSLQGWFVNGNPAGQQVSNCGDYSLAGGFQQFGNNVRLSRQFTGLPQHLRVRITLTVVSIDSWDNEVFRVIVDDNIQYQQQFLWNQGQNLCGRADQPGWLERVAFVEVDIPHTSSTLSLTFTTTLDQDPNDESWGVRDVDIQIQTCDPPGCFALTEEFTTPDFTSAQVVGWQSNQPIGTAARPWTTKCGPVTLFGGVQSFGGNTVVSKTFTNLPQHARVYVTAQLYLIDNWDQNWQVGSFIDDVQIEDYRKNGGNGNQGNLCGQGQSEDLDQIAFIVGHSDSTLKISFQDSAPDAQSRSWGIRNLRIYLLPCEQDCQVVTRELNTRTFQSSEVRGFTLVGTNQPANAVSFCDQVSVLGGTSQYSTQDVQKTYTGLPDHTHLQISLTVHFIDSWDNELFWILVDGVRVASSTQRAPRESLNVQTRCGVGGWRDDIQVLYIEVPHISSQATITFQSDLDENAGNEAWGIRDLQILAVKQPGLQRIANDFTQQQFTDLQGWSFADNSRKLSGNTFTSTCGGFSIVGGFNLFAQGVRIQKTFRDLPPHTQLTVSYRLYQIDSLGQVGFPTDVMWASVDGVQTSFSIKWPDAAAGQGQLCGVEGWRDTAVPIEFRIFHTASTATIQLYDTIDEPANNESWGFRDFLLYASQVQRPRGRCAILYSECNFSGKRLYICDQNPNFEQQSQWYDRVRSVQVPLGWAVTLYPQSDYKGQPVEFSQPNACLDTQ